MTPFERWSVRLSSTVVILSGVGFLWAKYFVQPSDPFSVVNHPLEPWLLKAHVLSAPILVFALGLIAVRHVFVHIRRGVRTARPSGLLLVATIPPMVLSGYLLQVASGPTFLQVLVWTHIASSVLFAVGVVVHLVAAARTVNGSAQRTGSSEPGPAGSVQATRAPASRAAP